MNEFKFNFFVVAFYYYYCTSLLVWAVGLSVMQLEVEATKSGVYGGLLQNPCVHYSVVHTHTHTQRNDHTRMLKIL